MAVLDLKPRSSGPFLSGSIVIPAKVVPGTLSRKGDHDCFQKSGLLGDEIGQKGNGEPTSTLLATLGQGREALADSAPAGWPRAPQDQVMVSLVTDMTS